MYIYLSYLFQTCLVFVFSAPIDINVIMMFLPADVVLQCSQTVDILLCLKLSAKWLTGPIYLLCRLNLNCISLVTSWYPALRAVTDRTCASQHACPLLCRPWPSPCNYCMLLHLLQAMPTGGLPSRLLALHWINRTDRRHSWQTWETNNRFYRHRTSTPGQKLKKDISVKVFSWSAAR